MKAEFKEAKILGKDDIELRIKIGNKEEKIRIREYLGWSLERISEEMERHASKEVFFTTLSAGEKRACNEFEEIDYRRYIAHCRTYAKLVLKGRDSKYKPTMDDLKDVVVLAFSRDTSDGDKKKFALDASKGEGNELFSDQFRKEMYKYEIQDKICYEDVVRMLRAKKEARDITQGIAEALPNRGHALRAAASDERAKVTSVDIPSVTENLMSSEKFVDAVAKKLIPKIRRDYADDKEIMAGMKG